MLEDAGIELPPEYAAKVRVLENFSPRTINDETVIADWIDMFTAFPIKRTPGWEAQLTVSRGQPGAGLPGDQDPGAGARFRRRRHHPAALGREVADAIPDGRYLEIADAGHLGFLEQPETVNKAMLEFFADTGM